MTSTIADAVPRRRTTVRGEVMWVTHGELPSVHTDAAISDGTGWLILRFFGRRSVPGIEPGRDVVAEGTPGVVQGDLVMLNPVYSLEDSG